MIKSACRRLIPGVAAVLVCAMPLFAQFLLDDLEHGGGQNRVGGYWYTYADGYTTSPITTPSGSSFVPVAGGNGGSGYAAGIVFNGLTGGNTDASIGIGTNLTADDNTGFGAGFNGVTSISFYVKGTPGLRYRFRVETVENTRPTSPNYNAHGVDLTIPATATVDTWTLVTVPIPTGISQENWGTAYTFNPANATKLSWVIKRSTNTSISAGAFAVDDIYITGLDYEAPDVCSGCAVSTFGPPAPSALLSDFDGTSALSNELGYFWYSYGAPATTVTEAASLAGRVGLGVSTTFTMGGGALNFAGVGTNLYDDNTTTYLDASNFTGIYFEYMTPVGMDEVTLEVHDRINRGDGGVYYTKLPGTNGVWMAATVPFGKLVLPTYITSAVVLDIANLAKIQVAYNGSGSGSITLDNVYFVGDSKFNLVEVKTYTVTYSVPAGEGSLTVDGITHSGTTFTTEVPEYDYAPTIKAVPSAGKVFVEWSDGLKSDFRMDYVISDTTLAAIFEDDDIGGVVDSFTVTYIAGEGGTLRAAGDVTTVIRTEYVFKLPKNAVTPAVTAQPNAGFTFLTWDDGFPTAARAGDLVTANKTYTATFTNTVVDSSSVTYVAIEGGYLTYDGMLPTGVPVTELTFRLPNGAATPAVTAHAEEGFSFVKWDDDVTVAARTGDIVAGNKNYIAMFVKNIVDPTAEICTLSYSANGAGGYLVTPNNPNTPRPAILLLVEVEDEVTVTAVAREDYNFIGWSDGVSEATRTDIATENMSVTAEFRHVRFGETYTLAYTAGENGSLRIGSAEETVPQYEAEFNYDENGPTVTAVPDEGYRFLMWSDNIMINPRTDYNVQADIAVTAIFQRTTAIMAGSSRDAQRITPDPETAVVAPVTALAGEFGAGPNPVSKRAGEVKFFRTGRTVERGALTVYDAAGNVVKKIGVRDDGANGATARRAVASWDLTDTKGRLVAEGTYLVRGAITLGDGKRERVSMLVNVVK